MVKIDPKIRFQNATFRQQLQNARHYKRGTRKLPETRRDIFLSTIGLRSVARRVLAAAVLLIAAYAVYFPNPWHINHIKVEGLDPIKSEEVSGKIRQYFSENRLNAQSNIFFISRQRLKTYLEQDKGLQKITAIHKNFPNSILVKAEARIPKYLINTSGSLYVSSNDGYILQELGFSGYNTSTHSSLVNVSITEGPELQVGTLFLKDDLRNFIDENYGKLDKITHIKTERFELLKPDYAEITVATEYYDIHMDRFAALDQSLAQLKLVLQNFSDASERGLAYIDLRNTDRAYACFKDAICAIDNLPPLNASTSTTTQIQIDQQ